MTVRRLVATLLAAAGAVAIGGCERLPEPMGVGAGMGVALASPIPDFETAAAALAGAGAPGPAQAATSAPPVLWGYIDGAGTAHFADRQVDSRYGQVLRVSEGPRVAGKRQGPESMLTWLEFAPGVKALEPIVADAARLTGVDAQLLTAVIAVESGYDARAVSPRGALGLMQLTPETADRYATPEERRHPAAQRLFDARLNVLTGARMLADLTHRYGGIEVALAAWNAGEGAVRRAHGRLPEIAETEAHVHMVLELYWALLQRSQPVRAHRMEIAGTPDHAG